MEEKKGQGFYSRKSKIAVLVVQMICVVLFGIFAALAGYLIYSSGNMEDLLSGKSYEESQKFIDNVSSNIEYLDSYMELQKIFETDGVYDEEQTVDIADLGAVKDTSKHNAETAYRIKDLWDLSDSGSLNQLRYTVEESDYYSVEVVEEADIYVGDEETLTEYSEQFQMLYTNGIDYETRLPVSGEALAHYAAKNKEVSLRDLYEKLCSAGDKLERYRDYSTRLKENSNFHYYVHDLDSGTIHTNGNWDSDIEQAWKEASQWELAVRYTRTPETVKFDPDSKGALEWLGNTMRTTELAGNKEEVIVALDTTYAAQDIFKSQSELYNKYRPMLVPLMIMGILSFLMGVACFVIATIQTGRTEKGGSVQLNGFDRVPTEVAAAVVCIAGLIVAGFSVNMSFANSNGFYYGDTVMMVLIMLIGAMVFMWAYLSVVRRMRAGILWKNSLCRAIINMCRKVYAARTTSRKLIIAFFVFFIGHIFLLSAFRGFGVFLAMVIDLLILLYLIKDAAGRQTVREGLAYIAAGNLEYKVDVSNLQGDNLEMAEAVNRVGEGLQKAVEKSMKDERMRSELITNVSHDIKTPLTSIINYVDLLKRENIEDEKIKNYIQVLDMKSQRLKHLTEDLVEASKVSSGNIELHMDRIQIQELLQQAYGELEEKFRNKNLEIIFNSIGEPAFILADGRQLWRIFENLLNNIAKYALANTRVYIDLRIINKRAVLTFKNISEQALNISADELTERFTRGDDSRTTEGSGLGLSIAKSLTELQKGSFEVYLDGDLFKVTVAFDLLKDEEE